MFHKETGTIKKTGNHTKTAAITAIALTAAVMAPAMTMRNTRGAQQEEDPFVGLEENAVWTDEENLRAELTVKIRGLDEVHTDSAQETAEPDQIPEMMYRMKRLWNRKQSGCR